MSDFIITLHALHADTPEEIRIRDALKILLRRYSLRCVAIQRQPHAETREAVRDAKSGARASMRQRCSHTEVSEVTEMSEMSDGINEISLTIGSPGGDGRAMASGTDSTRNWVTQGQKV